MKTTLSILAGITLLLAAISNRTSVTSQESSSLRRSELKMDMNKGCYLASEFAQFKKENIPEDRNIVEPVSEKVLFKAFVIYKKAH